MPKTEPIPNNTSELDNPVFDEDKYRILRGDRQLVHGEEWSTEFMLARYLQLTDELVGKLDGSIPLNDSRIASYDAETGEVTTSMHVEMPKPDAAIFLDKSARPISWMVSALWDTLAQEGAEKPDRFYLNIDREDWLRQMNVPEESLQDAPAHLLDYSKITTEDIEGIRALFVEGAAFIKEGEMGSVWDRPTIFDGKHVMIVDEVKSSGRTLDIALQILARAFPDSVFSAEYWSTPPRHDLNPNNPKTGEWAVDWVPVWYSGSSADGRAVGNKSYRYYDEYSERTGKIAAKMGRHVLSAPRIDETGARLSVDAVTTRLQQDIRQLAADVKNANILFIPSPYRETDDNPDGDIRQALRVNKMTDFEAFMERRRNLYAKGLIKK